MTQLSNTAATGIIDKLSDRDAPGLYLDSGEFIPAAQLAAQQACCGDPSNCDAAGMGVCTDPQPIGQLPPPAYMPQRHEIERRVHVTPGGVRFGNCFISHATILEGRGPITAAAYKKWLNLPG